MKFAYEFDDHGGTFTNDDEASPGEVSPPPISAENQASESWRIHRLHKVWIEATTTVARLSGAYRKHWPGAITALHDHKGGLVVTWRDHESRVMFEGVVVGAWNIEGEHLNAHRLAKAT